MEYRINISLFGHRAQLSQPSSVCFPPPIPVNRSPPPSADDLIKLFGNSRMQYRGWFNSMHQPRPSPKPPRGPPPLCFIHAFKRRIGGRGGEGGARADDTHHHTHTTRKGNPPTPPLFPLCPPLALLLVVVGRRLCLSGWMGTLVWIWRLADTES